MKDKYKEIILSDAKDLAESYAESLIDTISNSGVFDEIPVVKTIRAVFKFKDSFSERIFLKKLKEFLLEIHIVPVEKRSQEIDRIDKDEKYSHRVGEKILEIINRVDSDEKPKVIGKLFRSYLTGNLDYQNFLKLSHIVERVFFYDLLLLINYDENDYLYDGNSEELSSYGLTSFGINAWHKPSPPSDRKCYGEIEDLGKSLVEFGLKG